MKPFPKIKTVPKVLLSAIRQYRHNIGGDEVLCAFDYDETIRVIEKLQREPSLMVIRNKIKVVFYLEDGCSQEDGEVSREWEPINFSIYSHLFIYMINEAMEGWLSEHKVAEHTLYEVIFAHVIEHDSGGALLGEYFEPIYEETEIL